MQQATFSASIKAGREDDDSAFEDRDPVAVIDALADSYDNVLVLLKGSTKSTDFAPAAGDYAIENG